MSAAPGGAAATLPVRSALPDWERAALRRLGTLCGALVGVSVGLGGGVLVAALVEQALVAMLWLVVAPLVAVGLLPDAESSGGMPLWAAVSLVAALLVGAAALAISWARLTHWPRGAGVWITLAAATLASLPAHAANLAIVPLMLLGDTGAASLDIAAVAVAVSAAAGAALGAVAGRFAWAWMGHAMRPRWWRPEASVRR